jgi:hypothetical protein
MSSAEAELVALTELALQMNWLKSLLTQDLQIQVKATPLYSDNNSTVTLAKDSISSDRPKHIEVRHGKVQQLVESKEIGIHWVPTDKQTADILKKSLPKPAFLKLKKQLQVQDPAEDRGQEKM